MKATGNPIRRRVPEALKPGIRTGRDAAYWVLRKPGSTLRAAAYRRPEAAWVRALPGGVRRRFRLAAPPPGQRRVEIGSGPNPTPGYVHVDTSPTARSVDLLTATLPLPPGWAEEILSVHMIEHVPPPLLNKTLTRWFAVLTSGGVLKIHTPDGLSFARALQQSTGHETAFWAAQNGIYGYSRNPAECHGPDRLGRSPEHRLLLTFPVLRALLERAGFHDVVDVSGKQPCWHTKEWEPFVPGFCLEVEARKP